MNSWTRRDLRITRRASQAMFLPGLKRQLFALGDRCSCFRTCGLRRHAVIGQALQPPKVSILASKSGRPWPFHIHSESSRPCRTSSKTSTRSSPIAARHQVECRTRPKMDVGLVHEHHRPFVSRPIVVRFWNARHRSLGFVLRTQ